MSQLPNQELFSLSLLRLVGYGLLAIALVEFINLIIPPRLMNPAWELQTIGAFVERIPVPLLAMVLIYYGERSYRAPVERLLLKWLSWLSLALAVFFLLMIPLSINNTFRIHYNNNAQVNLQLTQQLDQIKEFKDGLTEATSLDQIRGVLQNQAPQVNIADSSDPQQLKDRFIQNIKRTENSLRSRAQAIRSGQRLALLKNSIRWNLGALIASFLFFRIWQSTLWARLKIY